MTNEELEYYPVGYDLNGGEGDFNLNYVVDAGFAHTVISDVPTREGYTFMGWLGSDGNRYFAGDSFEGGGLVAQWQEIPVGTVIFSIHEGTGDFPPATYRFDKGFTVPEAVPEWEGYDFYCWSSPDGKHYYPGQNYDLCELEYVLIALWSNRNYTMTFDPNGGSFEAEGGEAIEVSSWHTFTMNAPIREGYSFLYWEDEEGNRYVEGDEYNVGARDMTFMAYWEKSMDVTVTYDPDGGFYDWTSETIPKGTTAPIFEAYKDNCTFLYWVDQYGNKYYPIDGHPVIYQDTHFTAVWEEIAICEVTFEANGGDYEYPIISMNKGFEWIHTAPTKEGHTFLYWIDTEGNRYVEGDLYIFGEGQVTMTAVWDTPVYAVKYEGLYTIDYVDLGDSFAVTSDIPEKEGHNFVCWKIGENNYNAGDIVTPSEDMTFSAQWQRFANIMTFEGTAVHSLVNVGDSYIITSTVPEKEGHDFVCWRIGEDTYSAGDLITPTADMTFEAVWNPHRYTISFDLNGGSGAFTPIEKTYNVDIIIPENTPTKDDVNFVYWTDSSGRVYYSGDVISFNENLLLTAVWMADTYTLSFDLNGRIGSYEPIVRCEGERVVLSNTPSRVGYNFAGWRNKDNTVYLVGDEYVFSNCDDTLVAIWEEKTYDVTFDLDGGSWEMSEQKKSYYSNYTLPTLEPTKEKHVFYRWVDENNMVYNPGDLYKKNQPVTLKALWKKVYTITYLNADGDTFETQDYIEGETVTLITETPTNGEDLFSHWKIEGSTKEYYPGKKITENRDIVFVPVFRVIYTLDLRSGSTRYMKLESVNDTIFYIPAGGPTKEGYDFVCWRNEDNGKVGIPGELYESEGEEELYAVFVESTDRIVIYDLDGGTGNFPDQTVSKTADITTPSQVPEKEGYLFDCWEIVYANADTYCMNYRLSPDSPFPDTCDMVLRALWIKVRVTINNLPANGVINRATTPSLQLEAEVYPTESDFSETWSMPESRAMTRATSTGRRYNVTKRWESSNESIATVDQNGVITPKKSGIVLINLYITYSLDGKSFTILIQKTVYIYELEEDENVFTDDTKIPEEVRGMALGKMNEYYNDKPDIKAVVDGTDPDCNTCIFAFEGLGDPSLKEEDVVPNDRTNTSDIHPIWLYNAMMVVTKGKEIVYVTRRASTLPDKATSDSNTTLKEGIYTYKTGNHGWDYDKNGNPIIGEGTYIAMVPTDDPRVAWYKSNDDFCCRNSWGTNIHAGTALFHGNIVYYNSEGCQIIHFKDYISFGKSVGFLLDNDTLLDVTSISSLGATMHSTIGAVGDTEKDYSQNITVKYILDRNYDNQNPYKGDSNYADSAYGDNSSLYENGIFYPLNHKHIENVCIID